MMMVMGAMMMMTMAMMMVMTVRIITVDDECEDVSAGGHAKRDLCSSPAAASLSE